GNVRLDIGKLLRAGEDGSQAVVVPGGDRVELVVVTAGAGDGEAEDAPRHDIDLLVDDVIKHFYLILFGDELWAKRQESGGDHAPFVDRLFRGRRQEIAGDLLAHEGVIGDVAVERIDDVVTIAPRIRV